MLLTQKPAHWSFIYSKSAEVTQMSTPYMSPIRNSELVIRNCPYFQAFTIRPVPEVWLPFTSIQFNTKLTGKVTR